MLVSFYFIAEPILNGLEEFEQFLEGVNQMMIFMGLAISFSTLQDTTKTQNKLSKKIWESPVKGKFFLGVMLFTVLLLLTLGTVGLFTVRLPILEEISVGLIVLGIGYLGLMKAAIEMFENHRLDKK
jgi:hypothetical protein